RQCLRVCARLIPERLVLVERLDPRLGRKLFRRRKQPLLLHYRIYLTGCRHEKFLLALKSPPTDEQRDFTGRPRRVKDAAGMTPIVGRPVSHLRTSKSDERS